jgi:hypothetical protein
MADLSPHAGHDTVGHLIPLLLANILFWAIVIRWSIRGSRFRLSWRL